MTKKEAIKLAEPLRDYLFNKRDSALHRARDEKNLRAKRELATYRQFSLIVCKLIEQCED